MFKVTDFLVIGHRIILDFKKAYKDHLDSPVVSEIVYDYGVFRGVRIEGDTLVWPNGFDVDPEMLFDISARIDGSFFNRLFE